MTVKLYMAMSANGMIARADDATDFVTPTEWASYSAAVGPAGNLIVGRRTYEVMTLQEEFAELVDVRVVVVTSKNVSMMSERHTVARSPREALAIFPSDAVVIVAGGGLLNASFMAEGLVDEISLDIEPVVFTNGIPLFRAASFQADLELIDQKLLSPHEIQLHYRVIKK